MRTAQDNLPLALRKLVRKCGEALFTLQLTNTGGSNLFPHRNLAHHGNVNTHVTFVIKELFSLCQKHKIDLTTEGF